MNKFMLSKVKNDYIIYEYDFNSGNYTLWSVDRVIFDYEEEICIPYCKYGYVIASIVDDYDFDLLSQEDIDKCNKCDNCSSIEFMSSVSQKTQQNILNRINNGDVDGEGSVNLTQWEKQMLSDKENNTYLGEFESIKECRKYIKEHFYIKLGEE